MQGRKALCVAVGLATAAVALAGCSNGSHTPNYGNQYLQLIAPYNAASAAFTAQYEQHLNWTFAQVLAAEQGQLKAGAAFDAGLEHDTWPTVASIDIKDLITANEQYFADLRNEKSTELTVGNDINALADADARVRSDLGLPQVSRTPLVEDSNAPS